MRKLDGHRRELLHRLLTSRFQLGQLRRLLEYKLDQDLDSVGPIRDATYDDVVEGVIRWADDAGRVKELMDAVRAERPGLADVEALAKEVDQYLTEGAGNPQQGESAPPVAERSRSTRLRNGLLIVFAAGTALGLYLLAPHWMPSPAPQGDTRRGLPERSAAPSDSPPPLAGCSSLGNETTSAVRNMSDATLLAALRTCDSATIVGAIQKIDAGRLPLILESMAPDALATLLLVVDQLGPRKGEVKVLISSVISPPKFEAALKSLHANNKSDTYGRGLETLDAGGIARAFKALTEMAATDPAMLNDAVDSIDARTLAYGIHGLGDVGTVGPAPQLPVMIERLRQKSLCNFLNLVTQSPLPDVVHSVVDAFKQPATQGRVDAGTYSAAKNCPGQAPKTLGIQ